jgi:hypothetical protein
MAMTIGIDLGDRTSELCALGADGEVVGRRRFATTKAGLAKALGDCAPARVVIEVGTHSPWVSRFVAAQGHEVIVANPRAVRSIAQSDSKTDRSDAEQLTRLVRADVRLLHPVQHRSEAVQRHHALLAVRNQLVKARSGLVAQARENRLLGDVLDGLHHAGEELAVARPARRERDAAVPEQGGGDAVPGGRPAGGIPADLGVELRVDVDEAGRDEVPLCVDLAPAARLDPTGGRDHAAVDREVPGHGLAPRPVHQLPASDHDVVHRPS